MFPQSFRIPTSLFYFLQHFEFLAQIHTSYPILQLYAWSSAVIARQNFKILQKINQWCRGSEALWKYCPYSPPKNIYLGFFFASKILGGLGIPTRSVICGPPAPLKFCRQSKIQNIHFFGHCLNNVSPKFQNPYIID